MDGILCSIQHSISKPIYAPVINAISGSDFYINSIYADNGIPMGAILDENGEAITDLPNGDEIEEN